MGRRKKGRNVNGILLLDKPIGLTSNAALQKAKSLYHASKAGHTGSLDPLADGLLPVCFGVGTKISAFLLDADKRYRVTIRLGVTTTTGDAEGEVVNVRPLEGASLSRLDEVLQGFRGEISQLPPMHSALKHKGERLYKLARKGIHVEREPRRITIYSLQVAALDPPELILDVHCSKGTYVRTLAEDIGERLGCGGHVVALRRTAVGPYGSDQLVALERLEQAAQSGGTNLLDDFLLPIDSALQAWPDLHLTDDTAYYLCKGQAVMVPKAPTAGWVRLYAADDLFIGIGQILDDGRVAPKRLLNVP